MWSQLVSRLDCHPAVVRKVRLSYLKEWRYERPMETSLAICSFSADVNLKLGVLSALCRSLLSWPPSHNSAIFEIVRAGHAAQKK